MQKEARMNTPQQKDPRPLAAEGELTERLLRHLLMAALGALAAGTELFFGAKPFAPALVAASTEYMPAAALGAAAFGLISGDYLATGTLVLVIAIRLTLSLLLQRGKTFAELLHDRPLFRITAAAIAALISGTVSLLFGNFLYFDLFGLLVAVAAAPLATLLYLGFFSEKDSPLPNARELGIGAVVLTVILALREISFFGILPAAVIAMVAALVITAHRGILPGMLGGLVAGFCFEPRLAPAFLLAALAFGLLQKSSRGGGVLAGGTAAAAYAFLIGKNSALVSLLPALLTAGALFLATDSAGLIEGAPARQLAIGRRRAAAQSATAGRQASTELRVRELSGALSDLSGTFYELGSRMRRPSTVELRRLCDKTFDSVCPTCRHRELCWGTEYQITAQTVSKLATVLQTKGVADPAHLPPAMVARCGELPQLLSAINHGAALLTEEAARGGCTAVVAMDYAVVSRALLEALEEEKENFSGDAALSERVAERLSRHGYTLESAAVCGAAPRRCVILRGIRLPGRHLKIRELRQRLERVCRFSLGEPQLTESEGMTDIVFGERARFRTATVKLSRPKNKGDKYCGDSVTGLTTEKGYDYTFICDGMGSGNAAAFTSVLASTFLSRLLQAGLRADSALRMLNGFLAARGRPEGECSTTVDLLEIDRVSGAASLLKCGAAPTYLLRRGEISTFSSRTAPVGILEALDAERIRFDTQPGDVIVQISDGFTAGEEECLFLAEMLLTKWDGDAEGFARMALNHATGKGLDDLSIIVTVVLDTAGEGAAAS
ncbi:MAG: hypothetical protein E7644_03565 [Ruminococcaceae bacterium]|nr:hypothetical protein [Oscillospiraceae bacterium]